MEKFTDVYLRIDAHELCEKFGITRDKVNLIELKDTGDGELSEIHVYLDQVSKTV
jgi:hypothetical protein